MKQIHQIHDADAGLNYTVQTMVEDHRVWIVLSGDCEGAPVSAEVLAQFDAIVSDAQKHQKTIWTWLPGSGSWAILNPDGTMLTLERRADDVPIITMLAPTPEEPEQ